MWSCVCKCINANFFNELIQNQFGTKTKLIATPASRVAALNNVSNNIAKTGDVRLRVAAGLRDTAQVTSTCRDRVVWMGDGLH